MYPLLKMPKTAHLYKEGSTFKKVMSMPFIVTSNKIAYANA